MCWFSHLIKRSPFPSGFVSTQFLNLFVTFGRLGFLVDFLSHAAIVGFMGGAAIIIGLQQLKGLIGISHFTNKTDVISVVEAVWTSVHGSVCFI